MIDDLKELLKKLRYLQHNYKKVLDTAEENIKYLRQHEIEIQTVLDDLYKILLNPKKPFTCYYCGTDIQVKEGVCPDCVQKLSVEDKEN